MVIALAGFLMAIISGFFGSKVGSHNFGIVFVWILWWALLILFAIPLLGRGWCSICPIPIMGDWAQRGAVLAPPKKKTSFGRSRWPAKLRNIWLQNASFLLVALFSAVILTKPQVTAIVLSAFLVIAILLSLIFERRAFCRYLCPVGGFIGLYSQVAPLEVRVIDTAVCVEHTDKTCYIGNENGYGCPWNVFPPGLVKNNYCGTCLECVRTCPHDNIAINLRPFGADLKVDRDRGMDEAYKAFIMLAAAAIYATIFLGPWGRLKVAAYSVGSTDWFLYIGGFLTLTLFLVPGAFTLLVSAGKKFAGSIQPLKRLVIHQAYTLVPLGLAAWIGFSLSFVFTNFSYVLSSISDPFGWGWDIFGTAGIAWQPYLMNVLPFIQIGVLTIGAIAAIKTSFNITKERMDNTQALKLTLPVALFCGVYSVFMIGALVG